MSLRVVDAVGDRSLAHTKYVINTSSMHDQLHTHVLHLCKWLDAGSAQDARGRRRVSANVMIFGEIQCHRSCKLERVARVLAVSTHGIWSELASEHDRSLLRKWPLVEIFEKPLFATVPKLNCRTLGIAKRTWDPHQHVIRRAEAGAIHYTNNV